MATNAKNIEESGTDTLDLTRLNDAYEALAKTFGDAKEGRLTSRKNQSVIERLTEVVFAQQYLLGYLLEGVQDHNQSMINFQDTIEEQDRELKDLKKKWKFTEKSVIE